MISVGFSNVCTHSWQLFSFRKQSWSLICCNFTGSTSVHSSVHSNPPSHCSHGSIILFPQLALACSHHGLHSSIDAMSALMDVLICDPSSAIAVVLAMYFPDGICV